MIPDSDAGLATDPSSRAPSHQSRLNRSVLLCLGAILVLGVAIRFFNLGRRSLWLDEIISSHATHIDSFPALIAWVKADVDQAPAFATVTWLLRGLGDGEVAMRLPSAVAGVLTIFAVFLLTKRLFDSRTALIAALVTTILPFMVWYSQEARSYALLMLATTLQMLFVYRARRQGRLVDWAGFTVFTIFSVYSHYLALASTAAAYTYLLIGVVSDAMNSKAVAPQAARAAASVAVVTLAYLPWVHALSAFLRSSNHGLARYAGPHAWTLMQLLSLLDGLSYAGLMLAALVAGLFAAAFRAIRRRDEGALLLLIWLGLPIVALTAKLQGAVLNLDPRYLGIVAPAMAIVTAVGVNDSALWLAARLASITSRRPGSMGAAVAISLAFLLVVQTIPALATSISRPKDDYRGMAAYVSATTPSVGTVLALGQYAPFVVIGLDHYFGETGSPVVVVDGSSLDAKMVKSIQTSSGQVWGALFQPSPGEDQTALVNHLAVDQRFTHLLLVSPSSSLSPLQQARLLLSWDLRYAPHLQSALDAVAGAT